MIAWGNYLFKGDRALDSILNIYAFTFKYTDAQHFILVYAGYQNCIVLGWHAKL